MKLQAQLDQHKQTSRQRLAPEKRRILEEQLSTRQLSGGLNSVPLVGSKAPDFTLPDHQGNPWNLSEALQSTPVLLKFYRGTWCPYCNIELRAYQLRLPEIRQRGACFVAVSPESPDSAQAFLTEEHIEFPVLSDFRNRVARQYGLEFVIGTRLRQLMSDLGNDLTEKNGGDVWSLPIPGTFVISRSGRIQYVFAELDYTLRADPDEVLAILASL